MLVLSGSRTTNQIVVLCWFGHAWLWDDNVKMPLLHSILMHKWLQAMHIAMYRPVQNSRLMHNVTASHAHSHVQTCTDAPCGRDRRGPLATNLGPDATNITFSLPMSSILEEKEHVLLLVYFVLFSSWSTFPSFDTSSPDTYIKISWDH